MVHYNENIDLNIGFEHDQDQDLDLRLNHQSKSKSVLSTAELWLVFTQFSYSYINVLFF